MRRFSLSMLLVAICLLRWGSGSGTSAHSHAKAALERCLKEASPANPLLLMLFDLNEFKGYNDSLGHPAATPC